jgi:hydroxyethylthiazole kinase-like uncharacterized protein yjeF
MLPILTSSQIRQTDAYTIQHEPILSIDLMERAASAFMGWFINRYHETSLTVAIYCGTGNNGGDGLAIARMLIEHGYKNISIRITRFSAKSSPEFDENLIRLQKLAIPFLEIHPQGDLPVENAEVIIDALLGSGLNKPLTGSYLNLVNYLNSLKKVVIAVDVPTGLFTETAIPANATILHAEVVITFQQPKLNFLLPESAPYMDCFEVVNIGLNKGYIQSLNSPYQLTGARDVKHFLKPRKSFDHKGTYGHALIIAGQPQTMGAALLCSSACAYAGAGLTTACIPESGLIALNTSHPEVMAVIRKDQGIPDIKWDRFNVTAIGPGLGTSAESLTLLKEALDKSSKAMVIDADALNILAQNPELLTMIPKGSILTPHMKEFDRLFGEHNNWIERLQTLTTKTAELGVYIILKNRYTVIGTPFGKLYFNPTGNPAMASGGMGDVLTGILASMLAQMYTTEEACIIATYVHGKAADQLALPNRLRNVLATQIIEQIPATLAKLSA